jgi:DNA repair photolyase
MNRDRSLAEEPGAASPGERLSTLDHLYRQGVKTWASIEPVIDADESLAVIKASLSCVNAYKVGKLNHQKSTINWKAFCVCAVEMIREAGRKLYIKADLQAFAPTGFLRSEECDPETVFLPDRPKAKELF